MLRSRSETVIHTEAAEVANGFTEADQTEVTLETSGPFAMSQEVQHLEAAESHVTELAVEMGEEEEVVVPLPEFDGNEEARKNERAKANALMDIECLRFLRLFSKSHYLKIDELSQHIKVTTDWLKIALLIRADYLQALDSTIRITPDGLAAWAELTQLEKASTSEA